MTPTTQEVTEFVISSRTRSLLAHIPAEDRAQWDSSISNAGVPSNKFSIDGFAIGNGTKMVISVDIKFVENLRDIEGVVTPTDAEIHESMKRSSERGMKGGQDGRGGRK